MSEALPPHTAPTSERPAGATDNVPPLARLNDVSLSYDGGRTWALDRVNLSVMAGEHLCILGANGSGKSTLGRILAGAAAPDAGRVELMGSIVFDGSLPAEKGRVRPERYRMARHSIGIVLQNPEDQIVTTVARDDVAFGPENLGFQPARISQAVDDALARVGMSGQADRDPTRMSGGQQQRLAVAGNLAMEPRLIILDEPGAMLDTAGQQDIMDIMDRLALAGKAVVHITHQLDEARRADRVMLLADGRIVASGTPREVLSRRDLAILSPPPAEGSGSSHLPEPIHKDPAPAVPASTKEGQGGVPPSAVADRQGSAAPAVNVQGLSFSYPDADGETLTDLSFELQAGHTLAVMGRNGSGKSTLSRLLCALLAPSAGSIRMAGLDIAGGIPPARGRRRRRLLRLLRQRVGFVMQYPEHQLFADTVAQDVAYGPRNLGLEPDQVRKRVEDALDLLGVAALADRSPFDLSGGQQRLVAIAGIVACNPQVLVLDEVTASLDPAASQRIMALLRVLHRRGVTIVMNTHSDQEALQLADEALLLERGRQLAYGPVSRVLERYHGLLAAEPSPAQDLPAHTPPSAAGATGTAAPTHQVQSEGLAPSKADGPRTGLTGRLDPRAKIITFLLMMLTAFFISRPNQLALGFVVTATLFGAAHVPIGSLLKSVRVFLLLMLVLVPVNLFFTRTGRPLAHWGPLQVTDQGVWVAILYSCRFLLIILLGALLVETTTPTQMTDAFESLLKPLSRWGVHTGEMALVLSLALRFIPTLNQEVHSIIDAQAARGGSIESGALDQRLRAAVAIAVPVFAGALRHADNLSQALDARCYEGGRHRTHYRRLSMGRIDLAFIGCTAAYLLALLILPLVRC
ncbi:energy-coupling factor transporter ATPase [Bifidobacterium xylocopae]|uniref:energy-coupling factor transporter ATPase n=1 Tax=Bifidobacterium xylocopae TaxID=2493119 RepID=UPI001F00D1B2|nr:energy-coupling factor transporter ATPase [Bifidobacterium xylocopae]